MTSPKKPSPSKPRTTASSSAPTGGRRAAARQAQQQAQQQAVAAAKRRKTISQVVIVAAVGAVAIAVVATAILLGRTGGNQATPQVSTTIPLNGAQVPFATDGSAIRLGPDNAPARVDLWVDYSCSHCQEFEASNNSVLNSLIAGGNVAVSYHNIQIVSGYGTEAGSAGACVAVNDAAKWPEVNAALYANHNPETDGWSATQLADFAAQQGVNSEAQTCIRESRYTRWIASNTQASAQQGVKGTPTMFLNGQPTDLLSGPALTEAVEKLAGR